jgi:hypothetical protein
MTTPLADPPTRIFGPLTATHPLVVNAEPACVDCRQAFKAGDQLTIATMADTDDEWIKEITEFRHAGISAWCWVGDRVALDLLPYYLGQPFPDGSTATPAQRAYLRWEMAAMVEFGDPRDCDCCCGATRWRHCAQCHRVKI